ncbi:cell wall biogenesis protein Mhp1 [Colletotrichum abscissum]|uniref:Cell wall biogenesis protein Mhp1 n=1 Tax=Colletotrichum abscissum TaxID=1671311 RepID=A0A9P9XD70_9PEZI|nr:cell wall biogenesis protein Mhp1 [Colletotrichum abscissum]KAI3548258.1 cell wall biogenesis protein Mhp1 [Colletotrichum abscissum]KAK1495725.1 cell wall biogenesis protein Mhp1 [Colletotrichum abscissum]
MEQVHGVDVSWMTHGGSPKDRPPKSLPIRRSSTSAPKESSPLPSPTIGQPVGNGNTNGTTDTAKATTEESKPIPVSRPPLGRSPSNEKSPGPNGTPPTRRNSWFSNISSKFSSSPDSKTAQANQQAQSTPPKDSGPVPPKVTPAKNAVLAHAAKNDGDQPYTPAPPGRGQAGFLGVFRRLSSSGGVLGQGTRGTHGLVERKILNVDRNRERCQISDLHQAKLRRVAFSVDVEIAPMPKYVDTDMPVKKPLEKSKTKKMTEKGEGEALKNPKSLEQQKERDGIIHTTGETVPKEPETEGVDSAKTKEDDVSGVSAASADKEKDTKKKEKKKKSEEERKARKEKKRKQAEANGTIPMEIHVDDSDSSSEGTPAATPKTTASPTTNPVRIYRRCCQLRETPILKKITEQLNSPSNCSSDIGMVQKLDLTGYWMQLPDLITLGDYLAVVPVKEVILENCGLTDEGVRVILAGLLAAKKPDSKRRKQAKADGLTTQGGFVERLVLKNNKIGPEGWKHMFLFIYLCRTLKFLDVSTISFPRPTQPAQNGNGHGHHLLRHNSNDEQPQNICATLFAKAIGERLGGATLELLNLGETNLNSNDLGMVIDGIIQCGVKRLGLAHNNIDEKGLRHVARYLSTSGCEGLDLGGNDLRDQTDIIANAISEKDSLWALSLAECNLKPGSLCKIFPALAQLKDFRFIDLSHNRDLCKSDPSAIGLLRKYLPKLQGLRRVHLADVAMTSEQAIALAEILPEAKMLAHISFLENPELVKLADAKTEDAQEEACALYASFLAATRVSKTIVCVDIDVPSDNSGEVVKALAKQVVAYCLRNMERFPIGDISAVISTVLAESQDSLPGGPIPPYPDVLAHLVGHDVLREDSDNESAPDDDYVIGGTGVVKALTCCLKNRGDESRRQSGEFIRDFEDGVPVPASPRPKLPPGKAKDMSKHLLASARKIRQRLQPALSKARVNPQEDEHNLRKLMFLDVTLANIIKRFEDEFPETRVSTDEASETTLPSQSDQLGTSLSSTEDPDQHSIPSDAEDETGLSVRPGLPRTNSTLSHTSKALAEEEGRMHRAGHKIRSGIIKPEYYGLLSGVLEVGLDPKHTAMLHQMIEEIDEPDLTQKVEQKGIMRVFNEDRDQVREGLRALDPMHWDRFVESQEKARGNVKAGMTSPAKPVDENAIED